MTFIFCCFLGRNPYLPLTRTPSYRREPSFSLTATYIHVFRPNTRTNPIRTHGRKPLPASIKGVVEVNEGIVVQEGAYVVRYFLGGSGCCVAESDIFKVSGETIQYVKKRP